MMTGPLLTATGISLISCTFLSKEVYIVTVFLSNILFGLGLGCYATPSTDTAVMNAPENKVGWLQGSIRWAVPGGAMGIAVTASLYALWLPMGTASAAQYALLFNSAICLGSAVVTGLYCQQQKPRVKRGHKSIRQCSDICASASTAASCGRYRFQCTDGLHRLSG